MADAMLFFVEIIVEINMTPMCGIAMPITYIFIMCTTLTNKRKDVNEAGIYKIQSCGLITQIS